MDGKSIARDLRYVNILAEWHGYVKRRGRTARPGHGQTVDAPIRPVPLGRNTVRDPHSPTNRPSIDECADQRGRRISRLETTLP